MPNNLFLFKHGLTLGFQLDSFPVPYYMIVLRGNLTVRTASGSSKAFGVGSMVHVADGEGKIQPAGALALVLLPNRLPHTISMPMLPKDEQETYHFVTLKVLPKGESGIEYGRGVRLDRKWGSGLQTSRTIDILAMSLCDAYPTLTAPLHPAYSKYLNWTTWLGPGRLVGGKRRE